MYHWQTLEGIRDEQQIFIGQLTRKVAFSQSAPFQELSFDEQWIIFKEIDALKAYLHMLSHHYNLKLKQNEMS